MNLLFLCIFSHPLMDWSPGSAFGWCKNSPTWLALCSYRFCQWLLINYLYDTLISLYLYPIGVIYFEYSTIYLYFDSLTLASFFWQTMDNHELLLIIVTYLGSLLTAKKDRGFLFLNKIFKTNTHSTFLGLYKFKHKFYNENIYST